MCLLQEEMLKGTITIRCGLNYLKLLTEWERHHPRGKGAVVGILKIGPKKLFVYSHHGAVHEMEPMCVLDFYKLAARKGQVKDDPQLAGEETHGCIIMISKGEYSRNGQLKPLAIEDIDVRSDSRNVTAQELINKGHQMYSRHRNTGDTPIGSIQGSRPSSGIPAFFIKY
ncbi:ATAT-like protein [Mya arenaria]|uniref:ATAT-like protein n=1 Tax=Mya arenaria TaxID=6604 RepID=A0ABY7GJ71_MYAAR|nr:ATAT-like protein [Mya arenaria]